MGNDKKEEEDGKRDAIEGKREERHSQRGRERNRKRSTN